VLLNIIGYKTTRDTLGNTMTKRRAFGFAGADVDRALIPHVW